MEKQLILPAPWMAAVVAKAAELTNKPLKMLANYYSQVLERPVDGRETRLLLEAQAAFFLAIMPAGYHLALRTACLAWAVWAVVKCRRRLRQQPTD